MVSAYVTNTIINKFSSSVSEQWILLKLNVRITVEKMWWLYALCTNGVFVRYKGYKNFTKTLIVSENLLLDEIRCKDFQTLQYISFQYSIRSDITVN